METSNRGVLQRLCRVKPVSVGEEIATIIFTAALIVLANLFADRLQVSISTGTACMVYRIIQPGFLALLPLLTLRWALDIPIAVTLLVLRRRTSVLFLLAAALSIFDIYIIMRFLSGGLDTFFSLEILTALNLDVLASFVRPGYIIVLVIALIAAAVELLRNVVKAIFCNLQSGDEQDPYADITSETE